MVDTQTVTGFSSGIARVLSALSDEPAVIAARIAQDFKITAEQMEAYLSGEPMPEALCRDLALKFNVESRYFAQDFVDELWPVRTSAYVFDSGEREIDGYWGNLGLRTSAEGPTEWFPISDQDWDNINGENGVLAVEGLGGSALIIFPHNVTEFILLSEAEDHIEGDWEISDLDPVEGLPREIFACLADFWDKLAYDDVSDALKPDATGGRTSEVYALRMAQRIDQLGGIDHMLQFINEAEIVYRDGGRRRIELNFDTTEARSQFEAVMRGEPEFNEHIRLTSEPARFLNVRDIAWIRLPATVCCGGGFGPGRTAIDDGGDSE